MREVCKNRIQALQNLYVYRISSERLAQTERIFQHSGTIRCIICMLF